jgi:hypothetical protein
VRLLPAAVSLVLLAVVAGCRPQGGGEAPGPTGTPAAVATPPGYRVAVVDMRELVRAHRRWPELEALLGKIAAVERRLASPPPPPEMSGPVLGPDLQAEADRLQAAMRAELDALQAHLQARLQTFINDLRAEHEAKLADRQRELTAELMKVIEAKRDETQRELDRFELAAMAEYRIPLTNLRLKADVVGVTNEEEAKRLAAEAERIMKERDEKIRAKAQALEKQLQEFSQARNAEAEAKFKAMVTALEEEGTAAVRAKSQEADAEFRAAVQQRQRALREAMEARQKLAVGGAQLQIRRAQERYARQVEAEGARLRAELQALIGQRLRLEDSMIADVRIEIAALAQERKIDVVLTNALAYPGAIDLTRDLVARLKRS